jgi:hypothetical protein
MYRSRILVVAALFVALVLSPSLSLATNFSSTNFKVNNPVINELGGLATSTSFQLRGSIPYIEPRRSSSTTYINVPDFLGFPSSTASSSSSSTPSTSAAIGSFIDASEIERVDSAKPKPRPDEKIKKRVDFNHDGIVDFIDFSILLYYFDKTGAIIVPFDLNDDDVVDVVDISIFMYYWDGN